LQSRVTTEEVNLTPPPKPTPAVSINVVLQPKKRNGVGRPRSIEKGFSITGVTSKRQRLTELVRKRGPKPKMRGVFGAPGVGLQVRDDELF
jgi:hypothetical protein